MSSTKTRTYLKIAMVMVFLGMAVAEPAQAETIWSRLANVTSNFGTVKTFIIWLFFLIGVGGIGWAGTDMLKKSDENNRDSVSWKGIGIKFIAGAILVGLTVTTDTIRETVLGTSASTTSTANFQ